MEEESLVDDAERLSGGLEENEISNGNNNTAVGGLSFYFPFLFS